MNFVDRKQANSDSSTSPSRAVLITIQLKGADDLLLQDQMEELSELSRTLGFTVIENMSVSIAKFHPRYCLGTGNAEKIANICQEKHGKFLVFNHPLSPSQQRNWENLVKIKVLDRHEIILDIFAARASTREASLQVELAKSLYALPRLKRAWTHLSRQQGGYGIRGGEGEKQIEVDARLVNRRITKLKKDINEVRQRRKEQRKKRHKNPILLGAIIGYTNAGKSSLLNALSKTHTFVEDKLFATLDPTTRCIRLPNNQPFLLTDTVGFVRNLPHLLIDAFKSTLEEAMLSDFLVHVVDATSTFTEEHISVTENVLKDIQKSAPPTILLFNKIDLVQNQDTRLRLQERYPTALFLSTLTGEGIPELIEKIRQRTLNSLKKMTLKIPVKHYNMISLLHRKSTIVTKDFRGEFTYITAFVPLAHQHQFDPFSI